MRMYVYFIIICIHVRHVCAYMYICRIIFMYMYVYLLVDSVVMYM